MSEQANTGGATVLGEGYWLGESEGFSVRDTRRRLGIVERLVRDDDGEVSALVVLGGVLGFRRLTVARDAVGEVVPGERLVRVVPAAEAAPVAAGRAGGLRRLSVHLRPRPEA